MSKLIMRCHEPFLRLRRPFELIPIPLLVTNIKSSRRGMKSVPVTLSIMTQFQSLSER